MEAVNRAKKFLRRLRVSAGKKKYCSSPGGSLPPSPIPSPRVLRRDKKKTASTFSINKVWRR
jgi:hypothetical protein